MEDVCRVEPPDTPVESGRDLPRGGIENLLSGGTKHASACYFSEEACVHSAFINRNLSLRGSKTESQRQVYGRCCSICTHNVEELS